MLNIKNIVAVPDATNITEGAARSENWSDYERPYHELLDKLCDSGLSLSKDGRGIREATMMEGLYGVPTLKPLQSCLSKMAYMFAISI